MAKVKIQGNASGTGVLTVTAPNTSTDRTITLPDESVTLGAATPSITDNGDATAITIDSNENVGIAVTPESGWSTKVMQLGRTSIGTGNDATGGLMNWNAYYDGNWKYKDSLEATQYAMNNAHTFKVASSGSANGAITWTTGFEVLNDGKARAKNGLLFGTDTAAANTLDDYEEGNHSSSWTTGNSGSITMGRNSMGYVKVGKVVTITGEFDVGAVSSPVGGVRVSLPFAIASHTSERNMSFVTRAGMYHVPHHEDNPPLFIGHGGTSIIEGIYERDDNSFVDYNPQAGETIWLCFSYFTDS